MDRALRLWEAGGSRSAAQPLQRVSWALLTQPQSLQLPNALQAETPASRQTGWVVLGHPASLPSPTWTPAPTHLPQGLGGPDGDSWEQGEVRSSFSLWVWSLTSQPVGHLFPRVWSGEMALDSALGFGDLSRPPGTCPDFGEPRLTTLTSGHGALWALGVLGWVSGAGRGLVLSKFSLWVPEHRAGRAVGPPCPLPFHPDQGAHRCEHGEQASLSGPSTGPRPPTLFLLLPEAGSFCVSQR